MVVYTIDGLSLGTATVKNGEALISIYPKRRYRRGESWRQERESDNAII